MANEVLGGQQEKEKVKNKEKTRIVELLEQSFSLEASVGGFKEPWEKPPSHKHQDVSKNSQILFLRMENASLPKTGERETEEKTKNE